MQIAKHIPAYLLAALFLFSGVAYFLHLMPMPPMTGDPAAFMTLMGSSGYMDIVKVLEIVVAILLVVPKTRALALVLIAPIVVNILLFEVCIAKAPGIGVALVLVTALAMYLNREKYASIMA
jgi:putative oxidoreductase